MKAKILYLFLLISISTSAQVGIGTTTPNAQLDIQSTNQANPSNTDGILIPKVDAFPTTNPGANQNGMLVFLTTTVGTNVPGFYYWNHPTAWIPIGNNSNSGWNLNGNTTVGGEFVGTTNNNDLIFARNNIRSGFLANSSTAFGVSTLPGPAISLIGNSAFGFETMFFSLSGTNNSAFGHRSLRNNQTGNGNVSIGFESLLNSQGNNNVAVGFSSLSVNDFGFENTGLGFQSNVLSSNLNNATAIGSRATVAASNSLVLGSINGINGATSDVNVGIGTTTPQDRLHVVGNIRMVDGNEAVGRVLTSDANGAATWTDNTVVASGTLDQAYDFGGAGNGNTITADAGAVLINGTDGFVSTGTLNTGAVAPSGAGVRLVWNPNKAALRAGNVFDTFWDDANIGISSVALGSNTRASAFASVAIGNFVAATGLGSSAFGTSSTATGQASTVFGRQNVANGNESTAFGFLNFSNSYGETVLGIGATTYSITANGATQFRAANATDRLFVIGNAIDTNLNNFVDASERSDAMVILKNGLTRLPSTTNALIDAADGKAVVTKEWVDTNAISTTWSLTGNAGTNPSTNFIGTTDSNDLAFRTNDTQQALFTASGKSIFGNAVPNSDTWAGFSKTIIGTDDTDNDLTLRSSGTDIPAFNILRSNGTMASPTDFINGELGSIRFWRYSGTGPFDGYTSAGRIVSNVSSTGASSLILSGAQASHVIISNTGNVGIGVSPQRKLHVINAGVSGGTSNGNTGFLLESNTNVYQHFLTPNANESGLLFGSDTATIHGGIIFDNSDENMTFRTGGNTDRVVIDNSGNVGIGTLAPQRRLHISNTGLSGGTPFGTAALVVESDLQVYQQFLTPSNRESGLLFGHEGGNLQASILFNSANTDGLSFRTGGNTTRMTINNAGRVGIGRTPITNILEINGNASKITAGGWIANSDQRLKKNIQTLSTKEALKKLLNLRGVTYEWNDDKTGNHRPEGLQYGFIAQELQQIFPEKVTEDGLGYLQTAYGDYDPLFVQAIKELVSRIEVLENENTTLRAELENQQAHILNRLQKLEGQNLSASNNKP